MKKLNSIKFFCIKVFFFTLLSCSDYKSQNIIIKDAHLYLPLNGLNMTSGYMNINNETKEAIEILGIDCSPLRAEIHETTMNSEGIMKMTKINSLKLSPESSNIFAPGGKHFMLWGMDNFQEKQLKCSLIVAGAEPLEFIFSVQDRG